MRIPNLPPDLIEEILTRVPALSLKRLRSTCKQWNALFKDRRFTEKHFRKAAKQSLVLMMNEYNICSAIVNRSFASPIIEFNREALAHYSLEQVNIVEVFHCDGLLLCTTQDKRLFVRNPCLEETRWIPSDKRYSRLALGYGNNNKSCRSYKILRFMNRYYHPNHHVVEFKIYELNSDSWRVLNDVNPYPFLHTEEVSLKGNTYWIASDDIDDFLLNFDFTRERFKRMGLPPLQNHDCMALSVVRDEQLLVLHQSFHTSKMDIWVTNKIDTDTEDALLWSKSLTVDLSKHILLGQGYQRFFSFVFDEEKEVVLCCFKLFETSMHKLYVVREDDERYSEIASVEYTTKSSWPFIFSYVPSLVQIQ